jgi:hypothetical protein
MEPWKPVVVAGRVTLGLGLLAAVRLAVEIYQIRGMRTGATFSIILGVELFLAIAAIFGGIGVMRRRPWGLPVAAFAGAAGFVSAWADLLTIGPPLLRMLLILGLNQDLSHWAATRILLTCIQALWWPTLLALLFIDLHRPEGDQSTRRFWMITISAALTCAVFEFAVHAASRTPNDL